jgi:3-(3-hydroxy-phenyl)propionate hydroxylase
MTFVPMAGRRRRWEFMLMPGDTREAMERPERVRELLARFVSPDDVAIVRAVVYTFHALVVQPWRRGRVFLLGDAAHQMPPFLGQGMCSGVRDAANLAWKLDAVLAGGAGEDHLDTYQAEREPHVRAIIDEAVALGRVICTLDPEVAAGRDAAMRAGSAGGPSALPSPTAVLGPSPLVGPGGGKLSVQPWLGERRFDDVVGNRFAVVTDRPLPPDDPDRAWWAGRATVLDAERHRELVALLDGAAACVVRPDRYVLGRGALAELTAVAKAALGTPVPT